MTANYEIVRDFKIYVRKRKIMRGGRRVEGWQAGFCADGGGATSIDRDWAIAACLEIAKRNGIGVVSIVDLSK